MGRLVGLPGGKSVGRLWDWGSGDHLRYRRRGSVDTDRVCVDL